MGQYYKPVLKQDAMVTVYDRSIHNSDDWNGAKLMEHSWWDNSFMCAIGSKIYKHSGQVAWVGDYSNCKEYRKLARKTFKDVSYSKVWGNKRMSEVGIDASDFRFDNKFLYNHTKKQYVDLKLYYEKSDADGWCINPLSILTALGNGAGGGDYHGNYSELAGTWAWDEISIEDVSPSDYELLDISFKEYIVGSKGGI